MPRLFLVGTARSGAGVAAGSLARSGPCDAPALAGPTLAHPTGARVHPIAAAIDEALLALAAPPEDLLLDGHRWLTRLAWDAAMPEFAAGAHEMQPLLRGSFVLWDPRFVWTLPAWRAQAADARGVCVFRDPLSTVRGIARVLARSDALRALGIGEDELLDGWCRAHRRILELLRRDGEWCFLHRDQLLTGAGRARLAAFAETPVEESFPLVELRDPPAPDVPSAARALYQELCELASHAPAAGITPSRAPRAEVAVVVPVRDGETSRLADLARDLAGARGVHAEVLFVDQTAAGGLRIEGARVVRELSPARGAAYRRALAETSAPYVAWQDPAATPLPQRLARQLAHARAQPDADLVTSDLALLEADGSPGARIAVDLAGDAPPAFWQAGVLVRREALEAIDARAFVPCELALFRALRAAGRVAHLSEALTLVDRAACEQRAPWAHQDAALLDLARAPHAGPPEMTVLLACHDRKAILLECMEGFARQLVPPGLLEIVVIDDGSTDGTPELARGLELAVPFTFLEQANAGACAARNRGLPHARGRYVLFVNDDTIPFPDTVLRHLEAHRELADRRAIVLGTFEQPPEECANALIRLLERTTYVFAYSRLSPSEQAAGSHFYTCNASVATDAVRALGRFDESFPCYAEDTDYGVRLEELGFRIHYRPSARSLHRHRLTFDGMRWRQRAVAKAHVRFFAKHPDLINEHWARWTRAELEAAVARAAGSVDCIEAGARELARIDLARLERLGGEPAVTARALEEALEEVFDKLNQLWWKQGFLDGFAEHATSGFPELLERARSRAGAAAAPEASRA